LAKIWRFLVFDRDYFKHWMGEMYLAVGGRKFRRHDQPPEIAEILRQKLMSRPASERFVLGTRRFDATRAVVLASLPKGLSPRRN